MRKDAGRDGLFGRPNHERKRLRTPGRGLKKLRQGPGEKDPEHDAAEISRPF